MSFTAMKNLISLRFGWVYHWLSFSGGGLAYTFIAGVSMRYADPLKNIILEFLFTC
jgi:hypothetical protein